MHGGAGCAEVESDVVCLSAASSRCLLAPFFLGGRQRQILPCHRVSATSSLDLSPRVRDRCTDNSAMQRKLEESRREPHIVLWVIRSTMKIVTSPLSSLSLLSGCATCSMWPVSGPANVRYAMTLVMSCGCLSQSYAGRSIGGGCALPVSLCRMSMCRHRPSRSPFDCTAVANAP